MNHEHNQYGTKTLAPSDKLQRRTLEAIGHAPLTLDESSREIVRKAIVDHASIRQWRIWALNVRTNHVHVVVDAGEYRPDIVIGQFKQWSTRRLREANVRDAERVWTREGSTRYLFDSDALQSAIRYVLEGQGGDI